MFHLLPKTIQDELRKSGMGNFAHDGLLHLGRAMDSLDRVVGQLVGSNFGLDYLPRGKIDDFVNALIAFTEELTCGNPEVIFVTPNVAKTKAADYLVCIFKTLDMEIPRAKLESAINDFVATRAKEPYQGTLMTFVEHTRLRKSEAMISRMTQR